MSIYDDLLKDIFTAVHRLEGYKEVHDLDFNNLASSFKLPKHIEGVKSGKIIHYSGYGRRDTNLENLITKNSNDISAVKKENIMPPKIKEPEYSDGSFRVLNKKSGLIEYRFMLTDSNGVRSQKPVTGYSKQECFNKRTEYIAGKYKSQKAAAKESLVTWLRYYYETYRKPNQNDKSTHTMYELYLKRIEDHFKDIPLNKVTGPMLQEYLNKYSKTKNTQNKIGILIKGCMNKAFALRKIRHNPWDDVQLVPHKYESYSVIQPNDQNRILSAIKNPKYKRLFFFCCCTGLRIGEALQLRKDDINLVSGVLVVDIDDTSTKKHRRVIDILPELIDLPAESELLFPNITHSGAEQYFRHLFKELKIKAVIHSTRHTFISCCHHVGFREKLIQMYAGHSSIKMTMDTYTHILKNVDTPILQYLRKLKNHVENS